MKTLTNIKNNLLNLVTAIWLLPSFLRMKTEKKIAKILIRNGLTIAVAESCTGGLISSRLTDISGSSLYITENFVTYADEAKVKYLGVKTSTIKAHGVVSKEVAILMAEGLLNQTSADIALSITGIAGPTGGTQNKPVGLVYIGVANKYQSKSIRFSANKNLSRTIIKFIFCQVALQYLYRFIQKNYLKNEI